MTMGAATRPPASPACTQTAAASFLWARTTATCTHTASRRERDRRTAETLIRIVRAHVQSLRGRHGRTRVRAQQQLALRNSIIWCDSRAVNYGENAFHAIGEEKCLCNLLNSPGNFTASKLSWVKTNEPEIYKNIDKMMLPGDFIAMKLTGDITTTSSALSEGIFWDFKKDDLSKEVMQYFGFDAQIIPPIQNVFSVHGELKENIAWAQQRMRSQVGD